MVLRAEEMKNLNKVSIPRKDWEKINTSLLPQIKDDLQKWKSILMTGSYGWQNVPVMFCDWDMSCHFHWMHTQFQGERYKNIVVGFVKGY